jgi:hypothetical protein
MPGHPAYGGQNPLIRDAFLLQFSHQFAPETALLVVVFDHGFAR